jgi:tetratricopeptide (TPR) repeat protein
MPANTAHLALQRQGAIHFGAFLHLLRDRHGIRQIDVLACLPDWSQANYSRLEGDVVAPAFDQLEPVYAALHQVGVRLTAQDRQQYLSLARLRIESKKSYHERKSDREWDELRLRLSRLDQAGPAAPEPTRLPASPGLLETRHLVGREDWLTSILIALTGPQPRKLLALHGPTGIGKSSELHRLARHLLSADTHPHVILCILPGADPERESENALDHLLGSLLAEIGLPDAAMQAAPLEARITFVMHRFEKMARPVFVLVDNAEQALESSGQLALCWKQFLKRFLRSQHHAALVMATREWPGWHEGERVFIEERAVPPLSLDEGIALLHQQGLADLPVEQLQRICEAVGGIPQCLEWVASLVQEPLWLDNWETVNDLESETEDSISRRLQLLLDNHALFGGHVTDRLTPLLDAIIARRLSAEAVDVLHLLAFAAVPLSLSAVQQLCPRPRLLKELESVSLLVAYAKRVQALPVVAAIIRARLPLEQQRQLEERVIAAYRFWLDQGTMSDREMGNVIAELAIIYMKHHRLLDAADLLTAYGWMSFNIGQGSRLARQAQISMRHNDWRASSPENESGGLLLYYLLTPLLGKALDRKQRAADLQYILKLIDEGKITSQATTIMDPIRLLMVYHMNYLHFEEAQSFLEDGILRLESCREIDVDVQTSLLAFRAILLAKWSNYLEEQGLIVKAFSMREDVIALFRQCCIIVADANVTSPLKSRLLKKRLSAYLNYLGENLTRNGRAEEALPFLEQSIALGEQSYCNFGALAAAYSDMSLALMELGRYEEALIFDENAMTEVQRCADSGDTLSQDEVWVYYINRGRLYLRMGRVDEAEQLLQEAKPRLQLNRNVYRMFAERALEEIKLRRNQT